MLNSFFNNLTVKIKDFYGEHKKFLAVQTSVRAMYAYNYL